MVPVPGLHHRAAARGHAADDTGGAARRARSETAKALAIGRILTAFAGGGRGWRSPGLLIRRHGVLAITAACGFLAVYPDGVYAAHTVLIEPWLVLFCLAGRAGGDGRRTT